MVFLVLAILRTFAAQFHQTKNEEDDIMDRCTRGGCNIRAIGTGLAQWADGFRGYGLYEAVPTIGCADDCSGSDYDVCDIRFERVG